MSQNLHSTHMNNTTHSAAPFLRIATALALALLAPAGALPAETRLAVEEGLAAAFFANDLKPLVKVGDPVAKWPDASGVSGSMTTESTNPPVLVDEGIVGAKTLAVLFERVEPNGDDLAEWRRQLPYLNFPIMQQPGEMWKEATVIVVGTGLDQPDVFDMNPGRAPNFRHRGWVQFSDSHCKGSVGSPIPLDFRGMPIVQAVVLSRDGSRNSTISTYVNGDLTGEEKQGPASPDQQAATEPFEGIVIAQPRAGTPGTPQMGAGIGMADVSGRKGSFTIAAMAIYSRALTPEEVKKVSDDLIEKLAVQ